MTAMASGDQRPVSVVHARPEVVIVAYGAPELLRETLAPLSDFAVTIVDNSSQQEIADIAHTAGVRYWDPGANLGFGAGVNYALARRQSPGADVLLLNPDAVIQPQAVMRLQQAVRSDPRIATAGAVQTDADGRRAQVTWPYPRPAQYVANALTLGRLIPDRPRYVIGSVLLVSAAALAEIGGFDETFFLYAEEADWQYRAHKAGWRNVVVDDAVASHVGGGTSVDNDRREVFLQAGQERFLRKHYGFIGWQLARWAVILGGLVRVLLLRGSRRAQARARVCLFWRVPTAVEASYRVRG